MTSSDSLLTNDSGARSASAGTDRPPLSPRSRARPCLPSAPSSPVVPVDTRVQRVEVLPATRPASPIPAPPSPRILVRRSLARDERRGSDIEKVAKMAETAKSASSLSPKDTDSNDNNDNANKRDKKQLSTKAVSCPEVVGHQAPPGDMSHLRGGIRSQSVRSMFVSGSAQVPFAEVSAVRLQQWQEESTPVDSGHDLAASSSQAGEQDSLSAVRVPQAVLVNQDGDEEGQTPPLAVATKADDTCMLNFRNRRVQLILTMVVVVFVALAVGLGILLSGIGGSDGAIKAVPQEEQGQVLSPPNGTTTSFPEGSDIPDLSKRSNNSSSQGVPTSPPTIQPTGTINQTMVPSPRPTKSPSPPQSQPPTLRPMVSSTLNPTAMPTRKPTSSPTPGPTPTASSTLTPTQGPTTGFLATPEPTSPSPTSNLTETTPGPTQGPADRDSTHDVFCSASKLSYSDARREDQFGSTVAVSGPTVAVGSAYGAYVIVYALHDDDGGVGAPFTPPMTEEAILASSSGDARDGFGETVAVDGDTLVVGAPDARSGGYAEVYRRRGAAGGIWEREATLSPEVSARRDYFGLSVAIQDDTIVVGAFGRREVTVFQRDADGDGAWVRTATIAIEDGDEGDEFGSWVAIDNGTVAVGAPDPDGEGWFSGAVHLFSRSTSEGNGYVWKRRAELVLDGGGYDGGTTMFGSPISIGGDFLVVGAPSDDSLGTNSGAVFVYVRSDTGANGDGDGDDAWALEAKLHASDAAAGALFGQSVELDSSSGLLLVGAEGVDDRRGATYIFGRSGGEESSGTWSELSRIVADDGEVGDGFGCSVGISGGVAVVGARWDDKDGISNKGSTYVYSFC